MRCRVAIAVLLVAMALVPLPGAVDARQGPGCEGIEAYVAALTAAGTELEAAMPPADSNLDNWTSEEFAAASEAIAAAQESFAAIEPPAIAEEYHALLLEQVVVISQMFDSMATLGLFGAFIYIEQMSTLDAELEDAGRLVENACGVESCRRRRQRDPHGDRWRAIGRLLYDRGRRGCRRGAHRRNAGADRLGTQPIGIRMARCEVRSR